MHMKLTILAALAALFLPTGAHAADKALWDAYNSAKTEAKSALTVLEDGNTTTASRDAAITAYEASAQAAAALDRKDIQAWHLNNKAYSAITWFKNAGYLENLSRIEKMPAGKDKPKEIQAVRDLLKPLFEQIEAGASAALDAAEATGFKGEKFVTTVKSNRDFLNWVHGFVNGN